MIRYGDDGNAIAWPRFALWFSYPFSTAARFMAERGLKLTGHALVIGPLAFALLWKEKRLTPLEAAVNERVDRGANLILCAQVLQQREELHKLNRAIARRNKRIADLVFERKAMGR